VGLSAGAGWTAEEQKMNTALPHVSPDIPDKLRDAQRDADQKIVDELRDKISKLENKLEDMKIESDKLEAWVKSEKKTYRLQYYGPGGHM
jgi:predicted RNase H-like nuclease (RuvC/YqgF family)